MSSLNTQPFLQALVWCCSSCGFAREGGQPAMECPICEAYKTNFIDIPQHLEAQVRAELGDDRRNSAEGRARRLELLRAGGHLRRFSVKGRFTEAVHNPSDSRRYF